MFNSPVLDVAIGLVFIFLLYSLLATSIKEAIATLFSLRACMLKQGIIDHMLSDTPTDIKLLSIAKGIWKTIVKIPYLLGLIPKKKQTEKIGHQFYDHPLIKNYGASRIFPHPSYIPPENFSTVLIDVLKNDLADKAKAIATAKSILFPGQTVAQIEATILNSSTVVKIKELLDYYMSFYNKGQTAPDAKIDKETCKILLMHLKNSVYAIEDFSKKLESWFNDSMDRVSGWYKRQVQVILFIIGLGMAIMFNVDTVDIAGKLTTDKDARDKIVQLAIKQAEQYKDDPRVKYDSADAASKKRDSAAASNDSARRMDVFNEYQDKMDKVKKELKGGIDTANNLLALGWDKYGSDDSLFLNKLYCKTWCLFFHPWYKPIHLVSSADIMKDVEDSLNKYHILVNRHNLDSAFIHYQYQNYPVRVKTAYIWYELTHKKKKFLGFLILAFAVCLGAPFWFDLLSKLIKLRGTGKQESTNDTNNGTTAKDQQTTITVNTQKTGEEAVG